MSDRKLVKLIEGTVGGQTARISLEFTPSGGRQYIYEIVGQEVSREAFAMVLKLAEATAFEKLAAVAQRPRSGLVDRSYDQTP